MILERVHLKNLIVVLFFGPPWAGGPRCVPDLTFVRISLLKGVFRLFRGAWGF